jgi:DNA-binding CsgD family transcriptional regulator
MKTTEELRAWSRSLPLHGVPLVAPETASKPEPWPCQLAPRPPRLVSSGCPGGPMRRLDLTDLEAALVTAALRGDCIQAVAESRGYSKSVAGNYMTRIRDRFHAISTAHLAIILHQRGLIAAELSVKGTP